MPLPLYRRLELLELTPTTTLIQLADCSTRQPVGILEDVPVKVGEFVIPCDFVVVDMDERPFMPIILGATVPCYSWSGNQRAGWPLYPSIYVERGWISISLLPYLSQHLPPFRAMDGATRD